MQQIPPDKFHKAFSEYFGLNPTQEQGELMWSLVGFIYQDNPQSLFLLKGYAGTGKTSILGAFVQTLKAAKAQYRLLAPTGRAAKVLAQKSRGFAMTIHKQIYRRSSSDGDDGRMSLAPNTSKNMIYVVDEASMIGDYTMQSNGDINPNNLLADLLTYCYQGENCKVIFLGDVGQLPPVGADESPALHKEYLEGNYPMLNITVASLTEVVRQSENSSILTNATLLRAPVDFEYPKFQLEKNGDVIRLEGEFVQEQLETSIGNWGQEETIVITRSNKRANMFNNHIRQQVYWFEEELSGGDLLMAVKNNYYWLPDNSSIGFIANGEMIKVKRMIRREELYGFHFAHIQAEFIDYPDEGEHEIIVLMDTLQVEGPNLPRDEMKRLFYAIERDYMDEPVKKKRYAKIMKNPYFNALQVKFAYAVTCHKSQGGQWAHVYLDQGYLTDEMMDTGYYRWLYTAFTRATDKLFLMNFKEEFFRD